MELLYEQKNSFVLRYTDHLDFPPHLHDAVEIVYLKTRRLAREHSTWLPEI